MPLPFEEKLLLNVRQFANIAREKLPQGLSRDEVYDTMRARAESNRATMHNTNEIIRTDFIPLFDAPQTLTDAEADAYYDLARQFFTQSQVLDMGMAMQIHDALLHRARERGDVERIIRHLYWCGLLFLYWSNERYYPQAEVLFLEATSYEDQYFELGKETRLFFNRCLGNLYVTAAGARRHKGRPDYTPFFDAVQRATAFWQREDVRALDPDFPWAAFIVNSHQNTCAWVDMLRDQLRDDSTLARRVYESTMALYGGEAFFTGAPDTRRWPNARIVYMISVSKYHMGYLSAAETTARLKRLLTEMTPDDYSNDGMYRMLHVSIAMLEYMHHIPGISEQTLQAEELAVMDLVKRYFLRMPDEVDRFSLTSALAIFAAGVAFAQDRKRGLHELLRYTTFTHLPTHVHSLMTSMLMEAIAAYFLERQPERLIGVCDTATAEEVMRRGDEVLSEIRMAGYAHDAGKLVYLQTVSQCSRRLTDIEFDIIKAHADMGSEILKNYGTSRCIAEVALGHHKWYDGTRGYPEAMDNTASPYRFVIDICSIADSIDAATDSVGRSYATQRSLAEVIQEIQDQAGTRYSPVVAEALNDPALADRLHHIIRRERKHAYYLSYIGAPFETLWTEEDAVASSPA